MEGEKIEKINSLIYYHQNKTIYFINQNQKLFYLDLHTGDVRYLKRTKTEDDQTITEIVTPSDNTFYIKILYSENENYLLL